LLAAAQSFSAVHAVDLDRQATSTACDIASLLFPEFGDVTFFVRATNLSDTTLRRRTSFVKDLAPQAGVSGLFGVRANI
jgi:hypothetical protein